MIVLHAAFPIDPSKREEALDLVEDLVAQSQSEDGIIEYQAATDVLDPNVIRFFEKYKDNSAFESHTQTDHFEDFEKELPNLLAGEPKVVRFEVESEAELEL